MRRVILADTGPLYAALDPTDTKHEQARADMACLQREGIAVRVAYPTLCEAYRLVLYRMGISRAHSWLREVRESASPVNPIQEDYERGIERVLAYSDESLSLHDAVAAIVSDRLSIPVWTYDHHFHVMRAAVWQGV